MCKHPQLLKVVNYLIFQIFIPILHGLALAVKECSFDSDNFKFPLMVRRRCPGLTYSVVPNRKFRPNVVKYRGCARQQGLIRSVSQPVC